jgi:hypothetical protein
MYEDTLAISPLTMKSEKNRRTAPRFMTPEKCRGPEWRTSGIIQSGKTVRRSWNSLVSPRHGFPIAAAVQLKTTPGDSLGVGGISRNRGDSVTASRSGAC